MRDRWGTFGGMLMSERPKPFDRLLQLLGLGRDGEPASPPPRPPHAGGSPPGCEEVEDLSCEEAVKRVYEYLDGELDDEDAEAIRCHVEQCKRCYPMYNWERIFLDALQERADRPEASDELRQRVTDLLDREVG